jgi:hypothetical protein
MARLIVAVKSRLREMLDFSNFSFKILFQNDVSQFHEIVTHFFLKK